MYLCSSVGQRCCHYRWTSVRLIHSWLLFALRRLPAQSPVVVFDRRPGSDRAPTCLLWLGNFLLVPVWIGEPIFIWQSDQIHGNATVDEWNICMWLFRFCLCFSSTDEQRLALMVTVVHWLFLLLFFLARLNHCKTDTSVENEWKVDVN